MALGHVYDGHMLDITQPEGTVEVRISPKADVIWINVEGRCVLRICRIEEILLDIDITGMTGSEEKPDGKVDTAPGA